MSIVICCICHSAVFYDFIPKKNKGVKIFQSIQKYKAEWSLLLIGLSWMIFSLSYTPPTGDTPGVWYQRSGAIGVLSAVIVEFRLFFHSLHESYFSTVDRSSLSPMEKKLLWETIGKPVGTLRIFTLGMALHGTITWGYGDLLYPLFISFSP
ncbi:hypothetical protein [Parendozoicomonas sp. Alg238-R29]|uniref:hypothetical protein n=1 Tax=Parendozoicomonas sp. Alg238-R29 TaxID=2993446 RepID=UPI00248EC334|nr:hypothetical protein [Parendozoicomonas sp. Alg238-R29]